MGVLCVQLSTLVFGVFRDYIRWTLYNSDDYILNLGQSIAHILKRMSHIVL
jgi:hypothetical protein